MIVDLGRDNSDYMGIFGFSWKEKVATHMIRLLKGTKAQRKMWGLLPSMLNTGLVGNVSDTYLYFLAKGYKPASFSSLPDNKGFGGKFNSETITLASKIKGRLGVDNSIVLAFLRSVYVLARDGKIPMSKWDPKGSMTTKSVISKFKGGTNVLEAVKGFGDMSKIALAVGGIAALGYFLSQFRRLKTSF